MLSFNFKNMSVHISAKKGEIAKVVLQPGDPLRAKYIAENFLTDVKLVSQTRGIFYFTGLYKGKEISVGASGMGSYHGKIGFETFSHRKSIVDKKTWLDLPMRYQPYTSLYERMVRFFLK